MRQRKFKAAEKSTERARHAGSNSLMLERSAQLMRGIRSGVCSKQFHEISSRQTHLHVLRSREREERTANKFVSLISTVSQHASKGRVNLEYGTINAGIGNTHGRHHETRAVRHVDVQACTQRDHDVTLNRFAVEATYQQQQACSSIRINCVHCVIEVVNAPPPRPFKRGASRGSP
jgi:hypothetical protein